MVIVYEFCCVSVNAFIYTGLYYKPIRIVSDDSRIVNKIETTLTDDARVVIYDCHMFIVKSNVSLLYDPNK